MEEETCGQRDVLTGHGSPLMPIYVERPWCTGLFLFYYCGHHCNTSLNG